MNYSEFSAIFPIPKRNKKETIDYSEPYEILMKTCPRCNGEWKFYDGMLGYESLKCVGCGLDINDIHIVVN